MIAKDYPKVKLIRNTDNLGYGTAIIRAFNTESTDYYLIINPDIIVLPNTIDKMIGFMEKYPEVGLAGCRLMIRMGPCNILPESSLIYVRSYIGSHH